MPRGRKVDITSVRYRNKVKRLENSDKYMKAMVKGVERGNMLYSKPYDVALTIFAELKSAGFQIIPRPAKKGDK